MLYKGQKKASIWVIILTIIIGLLGGGSLFYYTTSNKSILNPIIFITLISIVLIPFLVFLGLNRTKPKFRACFIIFIGAVLIDFVVVPLRGGYITIFGVTGFYLSSFVGFWLLFIYSYFILYKYNSKLSIGLILLSLFLGVSILTAPIHIFNFESTKISFFQYPIHVLALVLSFFSFKLGRKIKIIIIPLSLILGSWLAIEGYKLYHNKVFYGSYTSEIEDDKDYPLQVQNIKGDTLTLKDFRGKYLVIDHWYTYCGVCYEMFPYVQKLYDQYKDHDEVEIITIHSRMENNKWNNKSETISTGQEILEREGYTMPSYSIDIDNPILKELDINGYPKVLIYNNNRKLVFRGNIEFAKKFLDRKIKSD